MGILSSDHATVTTRPFNHPNVKSLVRKFHESMKKFQFRSSTEKGLGFSSRDFMTGADNKVQNFGIFTTNNSFEGGGGCHGSSPCTYDPI